MDFDWMTLLKVLGSALLAALLAYFNKDQLIEMGKKLLGKAIPGDSALEKQIIDLLAELARKRLELIQMGIPAEAIDQYLSVSENLQTAAASAAKAGASASSMKKFDKMKEPKQLTPEQVVKLTSLVENLQGDKPPTKVA